jgi:hypothetical protein
VKAYKYLDVEENHNIEHKNEKEKLKEHVRRLRLILMDSITQEQTLIAYMFPEKREEED